jgi:ABC-type sugar transport system ATPase subunit
VKQSPAKEILRVEGIHKSFGSVVALSGVSLAAYESEIVGLVGDNGAGKSTLVKIISGYHPPDRGELFLEGERVRFNSPMDAQRAGIETIYQDLALCEDLDCAANFFIGRELCRDLLGFGILQKREMEKQTRQAIDRMGIDIPSVREKIRYLSGGQRQAIALARFAAWKRRLILLDEPTAALGVRESRQALELIARFGKEKGIATILIAHNLQHVYQVADRIVVLRHGEVVGERDTKTTEADEIVALITGAGFTIGNRAPEAAKT